MSFERSVKSWGFAVAGAVLALGAGLTLRLSDAGAADKGVGSVTYLSGQAQRARGAGDKWSPLAKNDKLFQGDRIKTLESARLEATLSDGSKLRLGERSELSLAQVTVAKKQKKRKIGAKLFVGRAWASVSRLFGGGDSEFEVSTPNAVAGVRGTRFAAEVTGGGDTTVRVYSGKVLVSNKPIYAIEGHTKAKRVQVAGPQEISKKQWEELLASAMQMVTVGAGGQMGTAESFALADPAQDDWESWNTEMDKLAAVPLE